MSLILEACQAKNNGDALLLEDLDAEMDINNDILNKYPAVLLEKIASRSIASKMPVYFCGGAVRDWMGKKIPHDLDVTVSANSVDFAQQLAGDLKATFVLLDRKEGIARVVWQHFTIDVSSFREKTQTIEDDLHCRDFTINAMALLFDPETRSFAHGGRVIDPTGGAADLRDGVLRVLAADVFIKDPLRLIRAYRFMAELGFSLDPPTKILIKNQSELIREPAVERISAELEKILNVSSSYPVLKKMAEDGILVELFPELADGIGMRQPASHHLDVFSHNLETLKQVEIVICSPERYFHGWSEHVSEYLKQGGRMKQLKLAALFHDVGKATAAATRDGRITFYSHDSLGAALVGEIAQRMKWSRDDARSVSLLVKQHMWPFHLNNAKNKTGITGRACLKLARALGEELTSLFILAMADSLAGQGPGRPENMEEALAGLFDEVFQRYLLVIRPVLDEPPLVTGNDLQKLFHLQPGPFLGEILRELQEARVSSPEMQREGAIAWVRMYLEKKEMI